MELSSRDGLSLTRKRIILTGGSGFLGRHVEELLYQVGAHVYTPRSMAYDLTKPRCVDLLYSNIRNADMVIHCAAKVGGIASNAAAPAEYLYDNLMMGTLLLDGAYHAGVAKFVSIGTVCSYPAETPVPFREADLWEGYPESTNAPYGIAKRTLLVQGQAYRAQYGFNAIHLILANLYGAGDTSDHVLPDMMRKFIHARDNQEPYVTLYGDGSPSREFLHVKDAARAVVLAAKLYDEPEPLNIGSGLELSIRQIAGRIAREVGYTGDIRWDTSKPNGQQRRLLDSSRAERVLGWDAQIPFAIGLPEMIAWYQEKIMI